MYVFFIAKVINCMGACILSLWSLILIQKIGLSKPQAGLMSTLFVTTQAPCLLFGGQFIDRIGRKKVIVFCQTFGAAIYIICAFLPIGMLTAILIMIAADFYTAASPAIDALIADITKPENRKASFTLTYFGMNIGYTISPLIGGILFQKYLPVLFVLDAVTTLLSMSLIMKYVKEPELRAHNEVLPDSKNESANKTSVLKVLWHTRILLIFLLIMMIYQFCYSQWSFMLPLQMADIYGDNGARNFSFLVALNSFTVVVLTPAATVLTHKFRSLTITAAGGFFYFAAFFMFGMITHLPLFLLAAFIMTLGEILITVNLNTFIADQTPSTHRGRINSISSILQGTCYAIAPPIMGNVIVMANYNIAWWIVAAFMLLGALNMFALDRKYSRQMSASENITAGQQDA